MVSNIVGPQGIVLSLFLFAIYITDFNYHTKSCHLQKFSDDSDVVGSINKGDETKYKAVVGNVVIWCEQNHLQLNVTKTRELVVHMRKSKASMIPVSIQKNVTPNNFLLMKRMECSSPSTTRERTAPSPSMTLYEPPYPWWSLEWPRQGESSVYFGPGQISQGSCHRSKVRNEMLVIAGLAK